MKKVKKFIYYCGNDILRQPLLDLYNNSNMYGLLVIGRKRAAIGSTNLIDFEIIKEFTSGVPSKSSPGGFSQRRFERVREEMEMKFYKRIAEVVEPMKINFYVGGCGKSKLRFLKKTNIKVLKVYNTCYDGGFESLRELLLNIQSEIG